jgi:hypothetical protein
MTKVSRESAKRDIADLVSKGILVHLPGLGRSTAYSLAELAVESLRVSVPGHRDPEVT